ncbi:2-octaprenyl-6-methoxyphenyl hydroxylase [Oceanisphaera sp. IT1-181]|uniref:2-octaprenyl-6-methoxyphenyl hydroxylase n=1 Tax=Oceanisphaera sp. IT1-181 TaxID=3081199 RepID=UPI0029CA6225|nr:2-octaprenyl-6-methoxyphenyl hydroxylase [Oceanisphaera sp. IT1-181]
MTHYDVVINGGGMAGAVLALGLSKLSRACGQPLRIAVIEHASPSLDQHSGFDARSIALAGHSRELLEQLGLWSLLDDLATPINAIQVTDQGHLGQLNLSAADYRLPALGYVVELHPVGLRLYQQLQNNPHIDLLCPAKVHTWQQHTSLLQLTLQDGRELSTQLLVGADGSHSVIAGQLKLERRQFDYQQSAIIANVQTQLPHQGRAFERFTAQGPLALLPMSAGRSSLVWCVSPARARELMSLDEPGFMSALQQEFGYRLGKITRSGQRSCYPLHLNEVRRPWHHRVVLVGNAAHLLHPIAGQGFNLGLRDVAALIVALQQEVSQGDRVSDLGAHAVLSGYGQSRLADQAELVGMTSALALLFSNTDPLLATGRNLGLMTIAACTSLKSKLAWRAMGKR